MRWEWLELHPRCQSQNVTGPRFRLNHSSKGVVNPSKLNVNNLNVSGISIFDKIANTSKALIGTGIYNYAESVFEVNKNIMVET